MKRKLLIMGFLVVFLVLGAVPVMAAETEVNTNYYADQTGVYWDGVYYSYSSAALKQFSENYSDYTNVFLFYNSKFDEACVCYYPDNVILEYTHFDTLDDGRVRFLLTPYIKDDYLSGVLTECRVLYIDFKVVDGVVDWGSFAECNSSNGMYLMSFDSVDDAYSQLRSDIKYLNSDIYCDGSVFRLTPPLTEIAQKVELTKVTSELIGVLPLVLGLVVSCLGLRKGLNLLETLLHRA